MISPELLRRYPFFALLDAEERKEVAMLADEIQVVKDTTLFEAGGLADNLYLLIEGGIDLYEVSVDEHDPRLRKEFFVGEIDPGEVFAISAVIEPYQLTATARVTAPSRLVRIDAERLKAYIQKDPVFGYKFMHQIARLALARLAQTRVLLAGTQG
jgi:CRP-like cAMP-binding protein